MNRTFFVKALVFEAGLGLVALAIGLPLGLEFLPCLKFDFPLLLLTFLGLVPLLLGHFVISHWPLAALTKIKQYVQFFYQEYLSTMNSAQLGLLAAAAGFGEELCFRWLFQHGGRQLLFYRGYDSDGLYENGLLILAISIFFGLAHALTKTYFLLTMLISLYLGFLFYWSDNLLVPILIHGLYDFMIFLDLKRKDAASV